MSEEGWSKVVPAFTLKLQIKPPTTIGTTHTTPSYAQITITSGTLTPHPSSSLPASLANSALVHGSDYARASHSGSHLLLDVSSTWKTPSGNHFTIFYKGAGRVDEGFGEIMAGKEGVSATKWGGITTQVQVEGAGELAELNVRNFVGSGRFVRDEGGLAVVYNVSEVLP